MKARSLLLGCCCALLGCVRGEPSERAPRVTTPSPGQGGATSSDTPPEPEPEPHAPLLLISDPRTLVALERDHGLSLAALLHEHPDAIATSDYGAGPLDAIERVLHKRLDADRAEDPTHTGVGLRHVHRQFEPGWLAAEDTRFELIGVVNRMDREVFARPTASSDGGQPSFGETRLIYRLAYTRTQKGTTVDSRLPMTVNVVFWQRPDDAAADRREIQRRWSAEPDLAGAELASWLRAEGHALASSMLDEAHLEAVEIDVQTERWPSTIRPDMAGHAEYLLEVFHREGQRWVAAPLENTPNLKLLGRDAEAREALLTWLHAPQQRAALDEGTIVVPERFLATAATSVTPRGFARLANRPWSQLFKPDDFDDFEFEGMQTIRSPRALLRRLDGLSCQGCHESRSIAGFHLLGAERDPDKAVDALAVFTSPHLEGELERRAAWHAAVMADEAPSEARALSEHERGRGRWGTRCGLDDPGFADWTCDPGLTCTRLADPELGTCLEPSPAGVGGVCELGTIKARADHHRDRVTKIEAHACAPGSVCNDNRVGFPDGMCASACASLGPESACGVIPNLRGFNDCLAADRPFAQCLVDTANPAGMRACSVDAPCRDDYICARSGSNEGVCLPPYFLFQLRVDGHPR